MNLTNSDAHILRQIANKEMLKRILISCLTTHASLPTVEPWTDYVKEAKRGNFSPLIAVEKMQSEGKI